MVAVLATPTVTGLHCVSVVRPSLATQTLALLSAVACSLEVSHEPQ